MTFNQWCGGKSFEPGVRITLEAIWNEIIKAGNSSTVAGQLLEEAVDSIREYYREQYRRW
jgi:hypothetical protein